VFRLVFWLLPWWFLAFIGLSAVAALVPMVTNYFDVLDDRGRPPSTVMQIEEGVVPRDSGEIALRATLASEFLYLIRANNDGQPRDVMFPLFDETGQVIYGVARVPHDRLADLQRLIGDAKTDTTGMEFRGWLKPDPFWANAEEMGNSFGVPLASQVIYLDLFLDGRDAAFGDKLTEQRITLVILASVAVVFLLLAVWKFRRWRARVAERRLRRSAAPAAATSVVRRENPAKQMHSRRSVQQADVASPWGGAQAAETVAWRKAAEADARTPKPPQPARKSKRRPSRTPEEIVAAAFRRPVRRRAPVAAPPEGK